MGILRTEERRCEVYEVTVLACDVRDCDQEFDSVIPCGRCKGNFCLARGHLFLLVIEGSQDLRNQSSRVEMVRGYYCSPCLTATVLETMA